MPETARRIVLASRPVGEPKPSDFRLEEFPVPQPGPGQLLLRTIWLSLDPYMRGRMSDAPSYAKPVGIGEVMEGGTVERGRRLEQCRLQPGDIVLGRAGWQTHALSDGAGLRKLDPKRRAGLHRARRARHAGHDRLRRACSRSASRRPARPWWSRPPPARSARSSARSPRSRVRARSASPAAPDKCHYVRRSSASTPASTTAPRDLGRAAQGRLPERHRRLFRERRRCRSSTRCCRC